MSGSAPALARYLLAIRDGATRRVELADELAVARPSVTKAVERLVGMGLVAEDGRHRLLLTAQGAAEAQALAAAVEAVERCLVAQGMAPGCAHRMAFEGAITSGCASRRWHA